MIMATSSSPSSSFSGTKTPPLGYSSPTSGVLRLNNSQPESVATPCSSEVSLFCRPSGLYHSEFEDDDDEDEENWGPVILRTPKRRRRRKLGAAEGTSTTQREVLLVKGNVTPSRAAPLFARFTAQRRVRSRGRIDDHRVSLSCPMPQSPDDDWSMDDSSPPPSPTLGRAKQTKSSEAQQSSFIEPDWSYHPSQLKPFTNPTLLNLSVSHRAATADVSSYLLALRTNSTANMSSTSSFRGFYGGGVAGSGVLAGCRTLGAGHGSQTSIAYKPLYQSLTTTSTPMYDLFTLDSEQPFQSHAHPLCGRYSRSSRCLSPEQAQWLAVGDNEGKVTLINTLRDEYTFDLREEEATPVWTACVGSVFELAWRHDDEVIATGGSDYVVRTWDTQSGNQLDCYGGLRGSPRSIAWDPSSRGGNIFVSGGRDGAIHLFDARVAARSTSEGSSITEPVLSIWGAHTSIAKRRTRQKFLPKGVTSLAYVPGRGNGMLASAGCADGILKLWDLRSACESAHSVDVDEVAKTTATAAAKNDVGTRSGGKARKRRSGKPATLDPVDEGMDLAAIHGQNKSTHGVSSLAVSSTQIFSACTDGRVYTTSISDLASGASCNSLGVPSPALFTRASQTNSLYARLALHDDERSLALGCHSGKVAIWDAFASTNAAQEPEEEEDAEFGTEAGGLGRATILTGHEYEINGLDWASGPRGPMLATVSDDKTIRTWQTK